MAATQEEKRQVDPYAVGRIMHAAETADTALGDLMIEVEVYGDGKDERWATVQQDLVGTVNRMRGLCGKRRVEFVDGVKTRHEGGERSQPSKAGQALGDLAADAYQARPGR